MFKDLNNAKIGNLLVFFAQNGGPLYLTKALKLLYFLDERAVRETGVPVTWLSYHAWKEGPVATEIYTELGQQKSLSSELAQYIDWKPDSNGRLYLIPATDFDPDEFTEYELSLLNEFASSLCFYTATKLVKELHRPGTLWDQVVKENDLDTLFKKGINISDKELRLESLIQEDEYKSEAFQNARESIHLQAHN